MRHIHWHDCLMCAKFAGLTLLYAPYDCFVYAIFAQQRWAAHLLEEAALEGGADVEVERLDHHV